MSLQARILVYGRDPILLRTRSMVLETTGAEVFAASQGHEAERMIDQLRPDLVVLCYSLTSDERTSVLKALDRTSRQVITLVLTRHGEAVASNGDETFDTLQGPRAFTERVIELLAAAPQGRAGR